MRKLPVLPLDILSCIGNHLYTAPLPADNGYRPQWINLIYLTRHR